MPFTPPHSGSTGGTKLRHGFWYRIDRYSGSGSGTSRGSGSGTSSSGGSGTGSSGSGTSSSSSSGTGTSAADRPVRAHPGVVLQAVAHRAPVLLEPVLRAADRPVRAHPGVVLQAVAHRAPVLPAVALQAAARRARVLLGAAPQAAAHRAPALPAAELPAAVHPVRALPALALPVAARRAPSSGTGTSGSGTSGSGSSGTGTSGSGKSGTGLPVLALPAAARRAPALRHRHFWQRYVLVLFFWWHAFRDGRPEFVHLLRIRLAHRQRICAAVGNANGNVGTFDPNECDCRIGAGIGSDADSEWQPDSFQRREVVSTQKFSYGTFEFTSRVAGVYSGSVTTGFLYATNSETEIDMEQVGNKPDAVDCTNWQGVSNFQDTQVFGYDQGNSHDFKIVWQPGYVDWYVDGTLVVHHTQAVPSAPAPFLFSAWGTNSSILGRHGHDRTDSLHVHQQLQDTRNNRLRNLVCLWQMKGCGWTHPLTQPAKPEFNVCRRRILRFDRPPSSVVPHSSWGIWAGPGPAGWLLPTLEKLRRDSPNQRTRVADEAAKDSKSRWVFQNCVNILATGRASAYESRTGCRRGIAPQAVPASQ